MKPSEMFEEILETHQGWDYEVLVLRRDLFDSARKAPLEEYSDLELAQALTELLGKELSASVGGGDQRVPEESDFRYLLKTLLVICVRLGVDVSIPFYDYSSFERHAMENGWLGGSDEKANWGKGYFGKILDSLVELEWRDIGSQLLVPVTPHRDLGITLIDNEITAMRRAFASARTGAEHAAIGHKCVRIFELLGDWVVQVWGTGDETLPRGATKNRFELAIQAELSSSDADRVRKYARASIELAEDVKHKKTPSRQQAGIAADGTIALANLLKRLAEIRSHRLSSNAKSLE